jgi:hypothetical protein
LIKKILPPLANGHNPGRLGTETHGGGVQTQWLEKTILISKIKHGNKAPLELDLGSMCKQPADKHCNLDQGQIKIKKISGSWGTLGLNQLTSKHTLDTSI